MKQITIWHTNDVHSRFERYCDLVGYVNRHRGKYDLFFDAGDFSDWQSPMVSGTGGLGGMCLLRRAGIDAMTVGNNEFLAGKKILEEMSRQGVPMVSCNLFSLDNQMIGAIQPSLLLERGGIRWLIIGFSPYWGDSGGTTLYMDRAHLKTELPYDRIQRELDRHYGQYDHCIVLSHGGMRRDRFIAEHMKGIDLIIGGHSHELISAERIHDTWIQQSGCFSETLGRLTVLIDEEGRITSVDGENIVVPYAPDEACLAVVKNEAAKGKACLDKPLYRIPRALDFDAYRECEAVNAICDGLQFFYDADFALMNNGIAGGPIGPVISRYHLLDRLPSGLMPTTVYWTGKQIKEAVYASFDEAFTHGAGKGAGYRGTTLGTLSVSWNVRIRKQPFSIVVNGENIEDNRLYRVITDDYLQRGSGYSMLGESRDGTVFHDGYIRDMLERYLNTDFSDRLRIRRRYE